MTLIELEGVTMRFGGFCAVDDVSLTVEPGARLGVIGPNGAGKSTLFKLISGTLRPTGGTVLLAGEDVTRRPEHARARKGIAQTFQHSSLFESFTCRDSVRVAQQRLDGTGFRFARRGGAARADAVLERVGLLDRRQTVTEELSHGERRQLEIAVALAVEPELLLLDEPSAGMSAAETRALAELIEALPEDLALVVVEHDLDFVFRVVRDVCVLHLGKVIEHDTPEAIRASPEVERVYLGGADLDDLFIDPEPVA
jgi:branched-chain amino acid transport system ATP-binding protein